MTRPGGAWAPDGRAKVIRADCEASLAALDGLPIDLYLLHAPDPRTPWRTSVRALARLVDDGLVARVGLANVNRGQLDEALVLAPVAAVEVPLSVLDDTALRSGVVERCAEAGLALIAHSPLGGRDERPASVDGRSFATWPKPAARRLPRSRWRGSSGSARTWSQSPAPAAPRPRARPRAQRRSSSRRRSVSAARRLVASATAARGRQARRSSS